MGKSFSLMIDFKGLYYRYGLQQERVKDLWFMNLSAKLKIDKGEEFLL